MRATHTNKKYTPGYIASRMQDFAPGEGMSRKGQSGSPFAIPPKGRKKSRCYDEKVESIAEKKIPLLFHGGIPSPPASRRVQRNGDAAHLSFDYFEARSTTCPL
jgi:hypothetical protein